MSINRRSVFTITICVENSRANSKKWVTTVSSVIRKCGRQPCSVDGTSPFNRVERLMHSSDGSLCGWLILRWSSKFKQLPTQMPLVRQAAVSYQLLRIVSNIGAYK